MTDELAGAKRQIQNILTLARYGYLPPDEQAEVDAAQAFLDREGQTVEGGETDAEHIARLQAELGEAVSLIDDLTQAADRLNTKTAQFIEVTSAELTRLKAAQDFQQRVDPWLLACFGEEIARDRMERNHRFFEEATELVQANGMTASEAHQLVDYTYGRPVGEASQEVGGVMVTLAALCLASGLDMHAAAETELARIWTKVEKIRAKPKHSPLPEHVPASSQVEHDRTVRLAALEEAARAIDAAERPESGFHPFIINGFEHAIADAVGIVRSLIDQTGGEGGI